jgi:HEAT repeat protein
MIRVGRVIPSAALLILAAGCGRPDAAPLRSHDRTTAEWVEALRDRDPKVRRRAVAALGHVGAADPAAVPALGGALKDRDPSVRDAAALALLNLGPASSAAAPALEAAQADRDSKVRAHAAQALARIRTAG